MDTIITTRYCVLLRLTSIEFWAPVPFLTTRPGRGSDLAQIRKSSFRFKLPDDGGCHTRIPPQPLVNSMPIMPRDPIELEIFKNLYHSIAEEMGAALRRTAFSPNIKERRDYSCAVFDADGEVIAMGDHMPVHLGSMPMSVRAAIDHCEQQNSPFASGDVVMLNDPFRGGTHLPDITLVAPV